MQQHHNLHSQKKNHLKRDGKILQELCMDVIPPLTHVPGYVKGTMHMVDQLLPWS